ncbi:MAG: RNA-binding cell elongation regulator Jag/EloR [Desulfococcaceae bacterium]
MPSCKEFEAKAVDRAVEKAAAALNIPKDKLKYNVISYGSSGIFGLVGAKKAKISVMLPEKDGKGRNRNRGKTPLGRGMETSASETVSSILRETFGDDAMDEKPEGESAGTPMGEPETDRPEEEKEWAEAESPDEDAEESVEEESSDTEDADEGPEAAEISPEVLAEATDRGREALERIIDLISGEAEISVVSENGGIRYNVAGGNAGVLIGKRGQTLEAIQYLVEKIVNKQAEGRVRVQVDVEGYLDNRKANLEELARKLADKTRKSGKPSSLGHMSAHDRRIVHLALKDDADVRTQSVGEGFYRKLVIFPNRKRRGRGK